MVFYHDAGLQRTIRDHVDFALVNLVPFDPDTGPIRRALELDMRLAELTSFFSVFSFHMPMMDVVPAPSVDAALAAGTKDFCLVQSYGHLFHGYDQLSFALKEVLDGCKFLTGALVEAGGYFYMHEGCVLVNRRAWERLGRPAFGAPARAERPVFDAKAADTKTTSASFGHGWNAVSASLAAGLPVQPWSERVKRSMWHCDTRTGGLFDWLTAMDDVTAKSSAEDPNLAATLAFLRNIPDKADAPKKVFVFNSEADVDLPQIRYRPGLDSAFVLASGFKANRILETFGFHARTQVVVYDYSAPALALRKMMLEGWDGRGFGAFFAAARPRIDALFPRAVAFVPHEIVKDPATVEKEFRREIGNVFGSEEHWLAHWAKYRALPHEFVEVDVLADHAGIRAMMSAHARGNAAIWISDMFNSPNAVGKLSWSRRRAAYDVLAQALAAHTTSDVILGGPPALWLRPQS